MQADEKPFCTMDSPAQGAFGTKAGINVTDEIKVKLEIPGTGLTYKGELKEGFMKCGVLGHSEEGTIAYL